MQEWIDKETATATFGTAKAAKLKGKAKYRNSKSGNERLKHRFKKVLDTMSRKPSLKFPAGCEGRAEVKAAYRFLDNEHVTFHVDLEPTSRCHDRADSRATGGPDPPRHDRTRRHAPARDHGRGRPAQ